jgi:hypothetical protein
MKQRQSKASVFFIFSSFPQTAYNIRALSRMDFPIAGGRIRAGRAGLVPGRIDVRRGRADGINRRAEVHGERLKKRSSQASRNSCSLGTPFPRSALFLK